MPAIINLRVLLEEKVDVTETIGEFQYRVLKSIIKMGSEVYYTSIESEEEEEEYLPIRIVAPEGGFQRAEKRALNEGRPFDMLVATLDEPSFEAIVQGVSEITRNSNRFDVGDIPARLILFNTVRSKLYRDFLSSHTAKIIKISSDMPVLIDTGKSRFPDLKEVFRLAEELWEYFSDESLPDVDVEHFQIKSYKLRGKQVNFRNRNVFSIDGNLEIEFDGSEEGELKKANALMHFTEFSGVGLFRKFGNGSVRITFL